MAVPASSSVSVRSLPAPRPKSPPEYPDLYGKRRETAKVQMLEREIKLLEEELKAVEGLEPVSLLCKEVVEFVGTNPDPLIPSNKKNRRSCRFWNWLCCKSSCFSLSWLCCCCCPTKSNCDSCSCSSCCKCLSNPCTSCSCSFSCPSCFTCKSPKLHCCSFPSFNCFKSCTCPSPTCPKCSSCCNWSFKCCLPKCVTKCPKVPQCCSFGNTCCKSRACCCLCL